jgi:pectin methylesterase-like acyl-CoA thioesterase
MQNLAISSSQSATLKVCQSLDYLDEICQKNCIHVRTGAVDFIFGNAAAWFEDCRLILSCKTFIFGRLDF